MKIIIEMASERYYRFLAKCNPTGREYKILKNAVEAPADPIDQGTVFTFVCELEQAKALLDLARAICPEAVMDIATSIDLAREG